MTTPTPRDAAQDLPALPEPAGVMASGPQAMHRAFSADQMRAIYAQGRADERAALAAQPAPKPVAWLCKLMQEDGSTREQIVTENPDGLRWNDSGEPSPYSVTPLYAAPVAQQGAESPERQQAAAWLKVHRTLCEVAPRLMNPLAGGTGSDVACAAIRKLAACAAAPAAHAQQPAALTDAQDAARYRTLRAGAHSMLPRVTDPMDPHLGYTPEGLDAAIDAAMAATQAPTTDTEGQR